MRFPTLLVSVALAAGFALGADAATLPANYLAAKDIQRGMKGYGLSVFQGTKIDRFDVEVIGVLRNAMPKQNIVLCRMRGAGLGKTGIIAGMSGSPVYLKVGNDYKLAGAVAYGWTFPKEPVCGLTPIENMYAVATSAVPPKKATARAAGKLDAPIAMATRTIDTVQLAAAPPSLAGTLGNSAMLYRLRTPLFVGGLSTPVFEMLRKDLEPLGFLPVQGGAAAGAAEYKDLKLAPGSALALRLVEGDMEMSGVGTCTEVLGNTVLGFGHPMMGEGRVSVPMATAVVHLCYPSMMRSFKLASPVRTVGRLTADVQAAVMGKVGEFARMIPMEARLRRSDVKGEATFRIRAFEHPSLTGRIAGYFLVNCLVVQGNFPRENTVRYRTTIDLDGYKPIVLDDVHSGLSSSSALMGAVRSIYSTVGMLVSNPLGKITIKSVKTDLEVLDKETSAGIESVRLERNDYQPGDTVRVVATLRTFKKESVLQTLELKLPDDFPPGNTTVTVCYASTSLSADRSDAPHRTKPRNVAALVDMLRVQEPNNRLFIRMRLPDRGLALKGTEMPSLPSSMLSVIASPKLTGLMATRKSIKAWVDTPYVVTGNHTLPMLVRPREMP